MTLLQKVEVFQHAMDNTTGQDLYRVLWLKSANSENWLERRTTYTRSLAVTSMVGYVLGLGDRHPSNILIDRASGKIIHIDFGDCFEVAMHRDKFPEKVPFRLTRMMIHAMEVRTIGPGLVQHLNRPQVSGIRGSYKNTCDITMVVLRNNRESLLAVLEGQSIRKSGSNNTDSKFAAFIYDPLISWRLIKFEQELTDTSGMVLAPYSGRANPTQTRSTLSPKGLRASSRRTNATSSTVSPRHPRSSDVDFCMRRYLRRWRREARFPQQPRVGCLLARAKETHWCVTRVRIVGRHSRDLQGRDFGPDEFLSPAQQVEKLILQATSMEALCQHFPGW